MAVGRYEKGNSTWVDHPIEGRVQVVHLTPFVWSNYPYTLVQLSSAESFTSVAYRAYGRAQDYWFAASMNPAVECPDDIVGGEIIRVPTGKLW